MQVEGVKNRDAVDGELSGMGVIVLSSRVRYAVLLSCELVGRDPMLRRYSISGPGDRVGTSATEEQDTGETCSRRSPFLRLHAL